MLSAGSLAAVSQNVASAGVPTSLMSSTVKAAAMIAAGQATVAGMVPVKVAALIEGVLKSMFVTKLKTMLVVLMLLGTVAFGGTLIYSGAIGQDRQPNEPLKPPQQVDAEDAFQAIFLVLARKASSVRPRERLANWLHGVALRTAMKAKAMTAKRRRREKQVTEMPELETAQQGQWRDLQPLLDQELNGLPENYRLPILLCDLEGKTIRDAAQHLGWPHP